MMELTRRNFLAGGLAAGALGIAGLAGCSSAATSSASSESKSESAAQLSEAASSERPWEVAPEPIADSDITETIESDVVIIGLGASGTYAATSAIENGLSVTVLERNDTFNANGGSHYMFNSRPSSNRVRRSMQPSP